MVDLVQCGAWTDGETFSEKGEKRKCVINNIGTTTAYVSTTICNCNIHEWIHTISQLQKKKNKSFIIYDVLVHYLFMNIRNLRSMMSSMK